MARMQACGDALHLLELGYLQQPLVVGLVQWQCPALTATRDLPLSSMDLADMHLPVEVVQAATVVVAVPPPASFQSAACT